MKQRLNNSEIENLFWTQRWHAYANKQIDGSCYAK